MGQKSDVSETLQLVDIFPPDAKLSIFELELNDETIRLFDQSKKKQEDVPKLKQVSEQQLSMVVQL